jgi:hypothetical protein
VTGVFVTHRDVTDERCLKSRYDEVENKRRMEIASLQNTVDAQASELVQLRTRKPTL